MLNYLKKFAVDIFPSVAATVIGAYIVNHYIVSKPSADAPAAAVSAANPKGDGKAEAKSDAKPAETTASVSNLPAAGVKAKGISEKAIMEKTAAERPAVVEKAQEKTEAKADAKTEAKADAKPDTKSADAKVCRYQIRYEIGRKPGRRRPAPACSGAARKGKDQGHTAVARAAVNPSAASVVAAAPAAPVETAVAPDERRDANDLARAAIERLRANGETPPRAPETARAPRGAQGRECARGRECATWIAIANAPAAVNAPALRPLPPPIMVSGAPAGEPFGQAPIARRGRLMPRPPTRTARPRLPKFRSRARSICVPKWPSLPCASAPRRLPRTRCRRPSRSSTRCCRNNSIRSVFERSGFRFA